METRLSKKGKRVFYTTDAPSDFDKHAAAFYGEQVYSNHLDLS